MPKKWDFSGWATKTGLRCSDGRTILKGAFKHCDGETVPLIWNHNHNTPDAVLGHALLEDRDGDIYAYCSFNNTANGQEAKEIVEHGDIVSLSIYANQLTQSSPVPPCDVIHGTIREVSMVLAGANPGAFIDNVVSHGDLLNDEAVIYHDDDEGLCFYHADEDDEEEDEDDEEESGETVGDILKTLTDKQKAAVGILIEQITKGNTDTNATVKHSADDDEEEDDEDDSNEDTIGSVIETLSPDQQKKVQKLVNAAATGEDVSPEDADFIDDLNDKQQKAVYALIGLSVKKNDNSDDEEEDEVKHNAFDNYYDDMGPVLSHSDMEQIFKDGKRLGSLKAAVEDNLENGVLAHAVKDRNNKDVTYGIADIDYLFPDARTINNTPEFIQRDMGWVRKVIDGTHHTPFSRVKSMFADITIDEARARGYVKGKPKVEEVFTLLKRATDPQTIYKKQKLDRDDVIDITDFDVVAWIKGEMRIMLEEEIARAILIGDGRNPSSDDKIQEAHIRPVYNDADLYTVKVSVTAGDDDAATAKNLINTIIKSRKEYKGSGNPTFFTTEDWLTEMLLLEDDIGHKLYKTETELATTLRVKEIVTVEPMEGQEIAIPTGVGTATADHDFIGVIVNLNDYNVGADKGGQTSFFDDFDIDYNQQKYLYETRMSGALVKPKSALSFYVSTVNA